MIRLIYTRLLAALMLVVAFTSCSDDMLIQSGTAPSGDNAFWAQYDFVLADDDDATTRVAYESANTSVFEEGDEIGVYAVDDKGNLVDEEPNSNVRYEVRRVTNLTNNETRQVLIPVDPNVRVKKNNSYRYVLYYPYNPNMTLTRMKSYTHTVAQDQGAEGAYEASDLLWAYYTPEEGELYTIEFDHAMAQIVIELGGIYVPTGNRESAVKLLNMPTQATGINLVQPLGEKFTYTAAFSSGTEDKDRMISTWLFEAGSTEDRLQYRACVPAHTIKVNGETPIVRVYFNSTDYKDYKINSDLELKPGYKYTFTLSKDGLTDIEVTDDDSWVLDVLDPETGEPVGLLCREYLRYQPQIAEGNYSTPDQTTGTKVIALTGGEKTVISSQAWVFYNLQSDGKTPELGSGKVLRFIYDIRENRNNVLDAIHFWPLPHTQPIDDTHQGLFTPEHGFKWIMNDTPAANKGYYGISSSEVDPNTLDDDEKEVNYYLHGGTVVWNEANGTISDFITPTIQVTNAKAKSNGHIAIGQDGEVTVNYSPIDPRTNQDEEGKKVGVIVPRNLIDNRLDENGSSVTTAYPLVKIGFNQFWMSKPFRGTSLTDGTPITCYNKKGNPDGSTINDRKPAKVNFSGGDKLGAGYLYPFAQNVMTKDGTSTNYDPYNDPTEMAGPQGTEWDGRTSTFRPAPIYNKGAVEDERFVTTPISGEYEYIMPTADEFDVMIRYFGYNFAAKLCTREIARMIGAQTSAYGGDRYTALMHGETYNQAAGFFTANISGFNLRAIGYYYHEETTGKSVGNSAALILKSQTSVSPNSVAYISFEPYDPWKQDPNIGFFYKERLNYGNYYTNYFAQVRLLMRFKNPTSGNTTIQTTRAGNKAKASRHVWLRLKP